MSTATPEPAAEVPARSTRVSSRVRHKSARALANEHTEQLLAAAREERHEKEKEREQRRERGESEMSRTADDEEGDKKEEEPKDKGEGEGAGGEPLDKGKKRRQAAPKKPRKSKYCVCKEAKQGPMIECGECGDWFHFECISLTEDEAERIHKYVCAGCTERTGEKTTYVYDIKGFPSPTPETEAPADVTRPSRTAPKRATKGKSKKETEPEPKPDTEPEKEEEEVENEPAAETPAEASTGDAGPTTEAKDTEEPVVGEKRKAEDENTESKPSPKPASADGAVSDAESAVSATSGQRKRPRREKPKPAPIHVPSPPAKSPSATIKRGSIAERGRSTSASIPPTPKTPVSKTPASSGGSAPLPPARKYVMDKLASAIRGIFGEAAMTPEAAQDYGKEVEASLYAHFKEMVKGKEAAGGRYKAQFNLLYSSLSKVSEVREDLRAAIVDGTIPPAKVATLTGVELASAAQLAVIEAANKEALRQTVMIKEREVRIVAGRDGLEDLDDRNETVSEMQRQEERDRRRENGLDSDDDMDMDLPRPLPRRESNTKTERRESVSSGPGGSPTTSQRPTPVKRGSSTLSATPTTQSPVRSTMNLSSAWGGRQASPEPVAEEEMDLDGEEDIDLSHIVSEDVDYSSLDDKPEEPKPPVPENTAMNAFLARPVEWSGALSNPAASSTVAPPVQLRLGAGRTHFSIPRLLPSPTIAIAGRVPTATSLKYLTDRLMDRSSELLSTIFTLSPTATPEDEKAWAGIVDFHVQRGRHGVFHPYDNRPVPGTARELYLVPLRPGDAWPDLFSLISGFALPREIDRPVMVGVFVASRERGEPDREQKSSVRPEHRSPMEPPPPPPPAPAAAAPSNLQLQALMASLNPAAIAGVMARPAPPPPQSPMPPPHQYEQYEREAYSEQYNPGPGAGYAPPSQNAYAPEQGSYYPPPPPGYGAGPAPPGPRFGGYSPTAHTAGPPVPGPVHGHGPGAGGPGGPGGPARGRPPFDPRAGFRGGFGGGRGRRGRGRGRW